MNRVEMNGGKTIHASSIKKEHFVCDKMIKSVFIGMKKRKKA